MSKDSKQVLKRVLDKIKPLNGSSNTALIYAAKLLNILPEINGCKLNHTKPNKDCYQKNYNWSAYNPCWLLCPNGYRPNKLVRLYLEADNNEKFKEFIHILDESDDPNAIIDKANHDYMKPFVEQMAEILN